MSRNMVNVVYDNDKVMQGCAYELNRLARAFGITGNAVMARELSDIANVLLDQGKSVIDSHGEMQGEMLRRSNESTSNILTALVSGIEMGRKEKV